MSMLSLIKAAAGLVLGTVGDLASTAHYQTMGPGEGKLVTVNVILAAYSKQELTYDNIKPGDRKLICLADELGVIPGSRDRVGIMGQPWLVVDWSLDVSGSVYTVQIRKAPETAITRGR